MELSDLKRQLDQLNTRLGHAQDYL